CRFLRQRRRFRRRPRRFFRYRRRFFILLKNPLRPRVPRKAPCVALFSPSSPPPGPAEALPAPRLALFPPPIGHFRPRLALEAAGPAPGGPSAPPGMGRVGRFAPRVPLATARPALPAPSTARLAAGGGSGSAPWRFIPAKSRMREERGLPRALS